MNIIREIVAAGPQTKLFMVVSILFLSVVQYFLLYFPGLLKAAFIVVLQLLFGFVLMRISRYEVRVQLIVYTLPSGILTTLFYLLRPAQKEKKSPGISLTFKTGKGKKITILNPFRGTIIFGGPGSGKTRWIIKPAIVQFAKYELPGVVYDYKRFDLSKTVYTQYLEKKIPVRILDFVDLTLTCRVNPLKPELLVSPAYANEAAHILFENTQYEGSSSGDVFFTPAAESVLSGVIWKLREDVPQCCTLPHAVSICLHEDYKAIAGFIKSNIQASLLASPFLQSCASEKTMAGIMATVSTVMRKFALPEIFYTLCGDDFSLDLNNPVSPSIMCINNYKPLETSLSPIISLVISVALKNMNNPGKLPSCVVIDEGATIKIPDFDNIPATGRENGIITLFAIQDLVQAEGKYGRIGRDKIISTCLNHFYGLVRDNQTAKRYSEMFGTTEKEFVSSTRGTSSSSNTSSLREVPKYKAEIFTELQVGEFYGVIAEGNVKKFNETFLPYTQTDLSLPIVNKVSQSFVKENFYNILGSAKALLNFQLV